MQPGWGPFFKPACALPCQLSPVELIHRFYSYLARLAYALPCKPAHHKFLEGGVVEAPSSMSCTKVQGYPHNHR